MVRKKNEENDGQLNESNEDLINKNIDINFISNDETQNDTDSDEDMEETSNKSGVIFPPRDFIWTTKKFEPKIH